MQVRMVSAFIILLLSVTLIWVLFLDKKRAAGRPASEQHAECVFGSPAIISVIRDQRTSD